MGPKAKSNALVQRQIIVKELSRLHEQYYNFQIQDAVDFEQLLLAKTKISNLALKYDEIFFQIDPEDLAQDPDDTSQEEHSTIDNKFSGLLAKLNVMIREFEVQQEQAAYSGTPVDQHEHVSPTPSIIEQSVVAPEQLQPIVGPEQQSHPVFQPPQQMQPMQPNPPIFQNYVLPPIPLPRFAGEAGGWIDFRSTFSNIVADNPSLSSNTKFYYLKQSLSGEALNRIQNVASGKQDFEQAWNLLKQRYDNPRLIADAHISALLEPPFLKSSCPQSWRALIDSTQAHSTALCAIDTGIDLGNLFTMHRVVSRFDSTTLRDWERYAAADTTPKLETLFKFMESQHKIAQALSLQSNLPTKVNNSQSSQNSRNNNTGSSFNNTNFKSNTPQHQANHNNVRNFQPSTVCLFCKETSHRVFNCPSLLKIAPADRFDAVKKKKLCLNCMRPYVFGHPCSGSCRYCGKPHHSLLHIHPSNQSNNSGKNIVTSNNIQTQSQSKACSPKSSTGSSQLSSTPSELSIDDNSTCQSPVSAHSNAAFSVNFASKSSIAVMPTAEILAVSSNGELIKCVALLDSGSDCNLISQGLASKLALPPLHLDTTIHTAAGSGTKSSVLHSVSLKSTDQIWSALQNCIVVNQISPRTPPINIDPSSLSIPANIKLANPQFLQSSEIDLLLGAGVFASVMTVGQILISPESPLIQNTKLGWIIFGDCKLVMPIGSTAPSTSNHVVSNFVSTMDISNQLERFWKIEEMSTVKPQLAENLSIEAHYNEHTIREPDGRFMVSLPRKENFHLLGQSEFQARKRFHSLEKRLSANTELKSQYVEFMKEYQTLNHMSVVSPLGDDERGYFIPHHPVFKLDSTTTKLRVVFDASAKSSTGVSLNDVLHVGPTVQPELFEIVLRFRSHPIAFIADIAKMYRQVLVNPSDRNFQRILWRNDPSEPIQQFQLNTITYGTAPAAFLATRTLNKLTEVENVSESVSNVIKQDFYVDDLISGTTSIEQAINLSQQLLDTLDRGGFQLRKWTSNSPELLNSIPAHLHETVTIKSVADSDENVTKALGLFWNPSLDVLSISSNASKFIDKTTFTKREFLSAIASIFDPLGLISPIVILPKIVFQKLWLLKIQWDDLLPPELLREWLKIVQQLPDILQISVPRCVITADQDATIQLHGFSDASLTAYGACIYVRIISNDSFQTRLLCSKSRVAPLKPISVPNLELMAALVLSRLINKVVNSFKSIKVSISNIFLWSDSKTVCNWIQSPPDRKSIFVSLRVSEIQETTSEFTWNHIRTANNPADIISRGSTPNELLNNSLWWNGPLWLSKSSDNWDSFSSNIIVSQHTNTCLVTTSVVSPLAKLFTDCSCSSKMIRVVAYILRYKHNLRHKLDRLHGPLSVDEIESAEIHLLKIVQEEAFGHELEILRSKDEIQSTGMLKSLSLFLHSDGLIRVGGRLNNANVSFDYQHQILLPKKHNFTRAIVRFTHRRLCHAGVQSTMSAIRQRFWIPSTRQTVKNILKSCVKCFHFTQFRAEQLMGQLPAVRVNADHPFINCGIDYAGPISIRMGGPKSRTFTKAYIALFVCMVTRAVHIEIVTELSTKSFLNALARFTAKRGLPRNLYSDNATTFQGANNELQELFEFLSSAQNQKSLQGSASAFNIQWNFIPPRAPHHGGLWESAIKQFKSIFKVITNKQILNLEELFTFSAQIEAILNSRPIVPLSEDPQDLSFLSPAHFLIGRPLTALPTKLPNTKHINHLARWHRLAETTNQLWQRWSQEYLSTLQKRQKWNTSSPNIKVGTLVLLKEPGTLPTVWKLGRIVEVFPGADDKVRVVLVLTESGTYKRSISSVAPLPIED